MHRRRSAQATVAEAMIRFPKTHSPATTIGEVREQFRDDHVQTVLIIDNGSLVTVIERGDLPASAPAEEPARMLGKTSGRVVGPEADLDLTHDAMIARGIRRLAVADKRGALLGLLCLKRTGRGFCSDADVKARASQ